MGVDYSKWIIRAILLPHRDLAEATMVGLPIAALLCRWSIGHGQIGNNLCSRATRRVQLTSLAAALVAAGETMPDKGAKFSSAYLLKEQIHSALLALPEVLISLVGEHKIVAMYGWAANIHGSLHWTPMDDHTHQLQYLIEDSIEQQIVVPGESDFIFELPEKRLKVTFCHESDIHLDGADDALLHGFMTSEPYSHLRWYTRAEVESMTTGDA